MIFLTTKSNVIFITVLSGEMGSPTGGEAHSAPEMKAELTCISEEGLADMDLPDNLLEDLDYIGDCITSCNKVEDSENFIIFYPQSY